MKRFIIPSALTIVLAIALSYFFLQIDLLPDLASKEGLVVDQLLDVLFVLAAVIFSLVVSFLGYSLVAFRRRPGDMTDAKPIYGHVPLEIVWTAIPLVTVIILGSFGAKGLIDMNRTANRVELVVEVTGYQWYWSFTYPEYGFSTSELVLPVNKPSLLKITSADVNHSFWIPEFRVKMDAIPGVWNDLPVTPDKTGAYVGYCAELCGTAHAYMTVGTRVVEEAEFAAWVQDNQARLATKDAGGTVGGPELGRQYAQKAGCLGCHSIDGPIAIGPSFQGLFGSQRVFEDGSTATADKAYIRNSILNPSAQIVQGFENVMPSDYGERLSEQEIAAIVEYIQTLK